MRFTWGPETYELGGSLDAAVTRLTLGEAAEVERHFKTDLFELGSIMTTLALMYTAVHRRYPRQTTWEAFEGLTLAELDDLVTYDDEEPPVEPDPTEAGTQTPPSPQPIANEPSSAPAPS